MKGNQGLEALANLCNNASKSNEDGSGGDRESKQNQNRSAPIPAAAQEFNSNLNYAANASPHAHQNQSMNGLPQNIANILKSMGSNVNQQQAANILSNASGLGNDPMSAMQQLAYMNQFQSTPSSVLQLMNQANVASQNKYPYVGMDPSAIGALFAATQSHQGGGNFPVLPGATSVQQPIDNNSMQPPQFQPGRTQSSQVTPATLNQPILMSNGNDVVTSPRTDETIRTMNADNAVASGQVQDKKLQKRAANRRSAQLSRKRKKQFIEELKEENDDLRRKEQILRSIPDLIVVFDSSGKLGFVSHSVSNFLEFTPNELVGTSFWERLCEGSVRLLKAAFMDALAARTKDHETTPLGSGVWELRLQDKDGNFVLVTLNGVVHFSGESPECVCSIRPMKSGESTKGSNSETEADAPSEKLNNKRSASELVFGTIKPEQSVVKTNSHSMQRNVRTKVAAAVTGPDGRPAAISDVDSGTSVVSSE